MKGPVVNPTHQLVILARLSEYCQYRAWVARDGQDPWDYMRQKLLQTEEALSGLKKDLLAATRAGLLAEMRSGNLDEERCGDYKVLFERLLSRGDFVDLALHLLPPGNDARAIAAVEGVLRSAKPSDPFAEERKPPAERNPAWEKLVGQLYGRLGLDLLGRVLARRPRTARRKAAALRRVRRNVAEYCTVMHLPTSPSETFTPFMLPRVEGLIAANLRFLDRYR